MAVDFTQFVPLQIQSEGVGWVLIGRAGLDVVLVLDDPTPTQPDPHYTNFSVKCYPGGAGAHPVSPWARMTYEQLQQSVGTLKRQDRALPPGLNRWLFAAFIGDAEAELASQPSARFNDAYFTSVARDSSGAIVGHFGLGGGVVGTIHDAAGMLSAEQHVMPLPPHRFLRLSRADRLSLSAALSSFLKANPTADPWWNQIAADAAT
jgi:hypothetical protein